MGLIRSVLVSRSLPVGIAVLAVALVGPTVWQGWVADDLIQRDVLLTSPLPTVLTGLFVFASPERNQQLIDQGAAPWWTLGALRVAFLRPLSALTHWVDYRLWPESGPLMHAQNIAWYGVVCVLAALVYRGIMGGTWIAGLAAFLFGVDIMHLGSVGWLANRNGLVAACFGLLAILAHDGWRRDGSRWGAALAPTWLLLSLLSAEAGVATAAYLAAHAIFLDRGKWPGRLGALAPSGVVIIGWLYVYQRLGYGSWGSGFYTDPAREPTRFVGAVLDRGPVLLATQWFGQFPMLYNLVSPPGRLAAWILAGLALIVLVVAMAPLIRRDRVARFWAAGMLLAVVPACSISLLSARLLLFVSLGAMGLMAQFVGGLTDGAPWIPAPVARRRFARVLSLVLVAIHAVLAPILMPVLARSPDAVQDVIGRVTDVGPLTAGEPADVVVVTAPSPFEFIYLPSLRRLQGRPVPRVRMLAPGYSAVEVIRVDERTLSVRPEHGYLALPGAGARAGAPVLDAVYVYQLLDRFFRSDAFPMELGAEVSLSGMRAQVAGLTPDGRASEARVHFDRSLDDPSWTWVYWDWKRGSYARFTPPGVGQGLRLPGPFEKGSPRHPARTGERSPGGLAGSGAGAATSLNEHAAGSRRDA